MFVDRETKETNAPCSPSREKEQQAPMKLSAAIRRGHTMIDENVDRYLCAGAGCALGAMWVGLGRTEEEYVALKRAENFRGAALFAKALGIPIQLATQISGRHNCGQPRLEIADWLESQGF